MNIKSSVSDVSLGTDRKTLEQVSTPLSGARLPEGLIGLEGAHAFWVSIFGGVEHLRRFGSGRSTQISSTVAPCDAQSSLWVALP
jgi:hypothetical protein